jgi:hypothetical protein
LSEIRSFRRDDLGAVASLFQKTFRSPRKAAPAALAAYLGEIFLDHPAYDPEIGSRVHVEADGTVTGFIGVFPRRMSFGGESLRAAVAGSLMVEERERRPLAGAKLLRALLQGPQDISVSETTNDLSWGLWQPLGGRVVPLLSLDWVRPLRPAGAAVSLLAERAPAFAAFGPVARAGDFIAAPLTRRRFAIAAPSTAIVAEAAATRSDFARAVEELVKSLPLRPSWSISEIEWLTMHAERKERYGRMHRAVLRDRRGEIVGCYLYHGASGGMGRVLQLLARPRSAGAVLDALLHDADQAGLSGLRGRTAPQFFDALMKRRCVFLHRASTLFHCRRKDVAAAMEAGDALVNGLAGERWARLIGGEF